MSLGNRLGPCLVGLAFLSAPALPAAEPKTAPTVTVRLRSIDSLIADFRYLATVAGAEEQAKQIDGVLQSMIGPKGLDGIDPKRPLGLYATLGPNVIDSTAVLLVPVANEKALLELLDRLNVKVEKQADGTYQATVEQSPVPAFFRFANKYAYVTARDKNALAPDRLLAPAQVLAGELEESVRLSLRLDQVPPGLKQLGIQQIELRAAEIKDRIPNDLSAEQRKTAETVAEMVT
ncbi:MAG: hypothetical protein RMJ52_15195, partial [Gemmataceae bacterium]|nr:hypothetical protein [Gemmataceae bacterium]